MQAWLAGPLAEVRAAALLVVDGELLAAGTHDARVRLDLAKLALEHDIAVVVTS
jgi:hypothetical protein